MKNKEFQKHVINEFSGKSAQETYTRKAEEGFWESEAYFFKKYFKKKGSRILDIGCGTGRTTIPLVEKGFEVIGVDITPKMIENAKKVAKRKKIKIDYRIGDATKLEFGDSNFDYALFSNQGWTQIPDSKQRIKALQEVKRVLKKGGIFIFTGHERTWFSKYFFHLLKQWIRFYVLKKIGFKIDEIDYGDRFFKREPSGTEYGTKQYIHIVSKNEVRKQLKKVGLELIETKNVRDLSEKDSGNPLFFVVRKK